MSLFRFPGGKTKISEILLEKIENLFKNCYCYAEPFFGGGSVGLKFLEYFSPEKSIINDKDEGIIAIWKSVMLYSEEFKEKINNFTPSVDYFIQFKNILLSNKIINLDNKNEILNLALIKLVIHQCSFSGLGIKSGGPLGGIEQKSKYNISCRWSPKSICKKIDKYNILFNKNPVYFYNKDYIDILNFCDKRTFVYLDPPYFNKGSQLYKESFNTEEHVQLSNILFDNKNKNNFKWLLSYDDCPEIRNLYNWAKIEEININYSINTSRNKKELIISYEG